MSEFILNFPVLKLIGVVIVIVGFALKKDTIATVVVAGIVTGFVGGLNVMEILDVLGSAFITNRTATLFVLTLPVIGLCERYGLKDKAVDLIRSMRNATTGKVLSAYLAIRALAAAFSIKLGGHAQFVRPLVQPMAEGAAIAKFGNLDEKTIDDIKGHSAAVENYGNFYAQNVFMGASGTLMIVTALSEQGYTVDALQIAMASIPIAIIAIFVGIVQNLLEDKKMARHLTLSSSTEKE